MVPQHSNQSLETFYKCGRSGLFESFVKLLDLISVHRQNHILKKNLISFKFLAILILGFFQRFYFCVELFILFAEHILFMNVLMVNILEWFELCLEIFYSLLCSLVYWLHFEIFICLKIGSIEDVSLSFICDTFDDVFEFCRVNFVELFL